MTVLTAEDPTVLASLINPRGRTDRSRAGSGLIERLPVGRSAEMRDLLEINGAWTEERHDAYKRCAFADLHRDTGAVTVRLHSHPVIA